MSFSRILNHMTSYPSEAKACLNNIYEFSPYLKENTHFTITKINWLVPFKETIPVYTENHMRPINTNGQLLTRIAGGTYSSHWALKD
jgi:hypothetical protein